MKGLRARFALEGMRAERLLALIGERGIPLYEIVARGSAYVCKCREDDFPEILALASERGFRVTMLPARGYKRLLERAGQRPGLVAGAFVFALVLLVSMRFVWRVEISGAGKYAGEARLFLQEMGVRAGMHKRALNTIALRDALEWRLPGVALVRVQLDGAQLTVALHEGTEATQPDTEGAPGDVVAARDGVLHSLRVFAGTANAKVGDVVRAGDVLILGKERAQGEQFVAVKARGEARARVWASASARVSALETISEETGRTFSRVLFVTPLFTIATADVPDYLAYDRARETLPLAGAWLPVRVVRETLREVALEYMPRDEAACAREAQEAAFRALREKTVGYEMVDKWTDYSMISGGIVEATATGEFLLDIARYAPYPAT